MKGSIWLSALAISAGFVLAEYLPGRIANVYAGSLGPLFASSWLSYVLRRWWKEKEASFLALPSSGLATLLTGAAFLLLLGGFRLLWVDPWMFGPMLWPLAEIALTLWRRSRGPGREDSGPRSTTDTIEALPPGTV